MDPLKPFSCSLCPCTCNSQARLTKHTQSQHPDLQVVVPPSEDSLSCSLCSQRFLHQGYLKRHMRVKHEGDNKVWKCAKCEKSFETKLELSEHHQSVHKATQLYTNCKICQNKFNQKNLAMHVQTIHGGKKMPLKPPVECSKCHKMFTTIGSLNKHTRAQHENITYTCPRPNCTHITKYQQGMKRHLDIFHSDLHQFCDLCGTRIKGDLHSFKLHIQRVHKKEAAGLIPSLMAERTKAKLREVKVSWEEYIELHLDDEKRLACPMCEDKFKEKDLVLEHLKSVHNVGAEMAQNLEKDAKVGSNGEDEKAMDDTKYEQNLELSDNSEMVDIIKGKSCSEVHQKLLNCPMCGVKFEGKELVLDHLRIKHDMA